MYFLCVHLKMRLLYINHFIWYDSHIPYTNFEREVYAYHLLPFDKTKEIITVS